MTCIDVQKHSNYNTNVWRLLFVKLGAKHVCSAVGNSRSEIAVNQVAIGSVG